MNKTPSDPIPSQQPLREQVADAIANAEYRAGTDRERKVTWLEVVSYNRECIRNLADAIIPMVEAAVRQQVELAYGLLWTVGSDRSTKQGNALYHARKALLDTLDKAGQARGIDAARSALNDPGASPGFDHDITLPSQPAPTAGLEPVAWQYLHHDPLSGSPVWLEKSFWNGHQANQSRVLYTRAQLEAHAAEQVRPLVEALKATLEEIERVEADVEYSLPCGDKARAAIRARGQV